VGQTIASLVISILLEDNLVRQEDVGGKPFEEGNKLNPPDTGTMSNKITRDKNLTISIEKFLSDRI
jgi:hypothetical protein